MNVAIQILSCRADGFVCHAKLRLH